MISFVLCFVACHAEVFYSVRVNVLQQISSQRRGVSVASVSNLKPEVKHTKGKRDLLFIENIKKGSLEIFKKIF